MESTLTLSRHRPTDPPSQIPQNVANSRKLTDSGTSTRRIWDLLYQWHGFYVQRIEICSVVSSWLVSVTDRSRAGSRKYAVKRTATQCFCDCYIGFYQIPKTETTSELLLQSVLTSPCNHISSRYPSIHHRSRQS